MDPKHVSAIEASFPCSYLFLGDTDVVLSEPSGSVLRRVGAFLVHLEIGDAVRYVWSEPNRPEPVTVVASRELSAPSDAVRAFHTGDLPVE
jgi:hypothetical protein